VHQPHRHAAGRHREQRVVAHVAQRGRLLGEARDGADLLADSRLQTLMTSSAPDVASVRPVRFHATPRTWFVWPSNDRTSLPVFTSNTRANLSAAALASSAPSGVNDRSNTVSLWAPADLAQQRPVGRVPEQQLAVARRHRRRRSPGSCRRG
jgi:hypothetical protein